jgi:hypothetical protein
MWVLCALTVASALTAGLVPAPDNEAALDGQGRPAAVADVRHGHMAARDIERPDDANGGATTEGGDRRATDWSTPETAPGMSRLFLGKQTDAEGNRDVWMFIGNMAYRSTGHGAFQEVGDMGMTLSPGAYDPFTAVIDQNDNVMVFGENIDGGVKMVRYEAGTGWSAPTELYHGEVYQLHAQADENDNVIVVMDGAYRIYDATTATWGDLQPILLPGGRLPETMSKDYTASHRLVSNRSGSAIYLLYLVRDQLVGSEYPEDIVCLNYPWQLSCVCVNRYDPVTRQFSRAEVIPNTWMASGGSGAAYAPMLATVDNVGNLTVLWSRGENGSSRQRVCASRLHNGVWQPTHEIAVRGNDDLNAFRQSSIDVNAAGDIVAVFIGKSDIQLDFGVVKCYAARYRAADDQWDAATLVHGTPSDPYINPVRCCFYEGEQAVLTMRTEAMAGQVRSGSFLYDGTRWMTEPLYAGTSGALGGQELVSDNGEVLWLFSEDSDYWSTWLRSTP